MDKLKAKAWSARNRVAEHASRGTGTASLSGPHSTQPPDDNASILAVNEGAPGTAARDFAIPHGQPVHQPVIEPPTSLQSSVDAGKPVATPGPSNSGPKYGSPSLPASASSPPGASRTPGRARSSSAPQRPNPQSPLSRPGAGTRQSSIGIRRMPSSPALRQEAAAETGAPAHALRPANSRLAVLDETCAMENPQATPTSDSSTEPGDEKDQPGRLRRASQAIQSRLGLRKDAENDNFIPPTGTAVPQEHYRDYNSNMVDVLDTIDPEVQTLTSLTNVQNSLFIPNLGRFVNRRPTYTLRQAPSERQSLEEINDILAPALAEQQEERPVPSPPELTRTSTAGTMATITTIDSHMSESRYAVLPHGTSLEGWSKDDKKELNDHVRHMLHSRRSKFKRSMRGFGQYVRRPLGFAVTLYATLITIFGLSWVLFLIGWVNVGGKQIYIVHIIDSVLVALFAIVGDGLAPFRAVDTYHMIYIAHYHHLTWSRRKKDMLPKLHDHNDLPSANAPISGPRTIDPEDPEKQWEFTVLTPKQQAKLEYHQAKFSKSHSFYKPHETETHYAFPLRLLVAIVVLLDCHSMLQISLGACTWGIYYKVRPFAITTVILCCSITCNATAGLLIMIGDKRTRKKDVLERMNRQELTEEAMRRIEKKKERESESEREDNEDRRKSKDARRSLDIFRINGEGGKLRKDKKEEEEKKEKKKEKEEEASAYP